MLTFRWLNFEDPFVGPAALTEWLCAKGFFDLRYDFHPGGESFHPGDDSEGW